MNRRSACLVNGKRARAADGSISLVCTGSYSVLTQSKANKICWGAFGNKKLCRCADVYVLLFQARMTCCGL